MANPYLCRMASRHSSFDNDSPLTMVGVMDIHAPDSVLRVVRRESGLDMGAVRERSVVAAAAFLASVAAVQPSCIACWWVAIERGVWSSSELVRAAVHTVEVE